MQQRQFYQALPQHQHMHFLCKVILFFAVLHVIFLQYEEKIFQLQTLKVLKQHFLTSDMYSKLLYKTLKEDSPEKKKKKPTQNPTKTDVVGETCSTM